MINPKSLHPTFGVYYTSINSYKGLNSPYGSKSTLPRWPHTLPVASLGRWSTLLASLAFLGVYSNFIFLLTVPYIALPAMSCKN